MCNSTDYGRLSLLCTLHLLAVILFAIGFFPTQSRRLPSHQDARAVRQLQDVIRDEKCVRNLEQVISRDVVTRLVIVMIDAWRSGFYFDTTNCKMPFLCALQHYGQAFAFDAHVQTPTVTMPRIKAFTAGVVPSFGDVVLNFASNEISDDNIVDRLKQADFRIHFCGDDTWFRLFPNRFENDSEGTVSFFVSDYTEVDDNVTRCMKRKWDREGIRDWDVMILHYLGLDHIGHSLGGGHKALDVKLAEMDSIIKQLHFKLRKVLNESFWMVILGDHGMTEAGGHGGSSSRETFIPLVFVDGSREYGNVSTDNAVRPTKPMSSAEQIDMVPTIASLMDIGIPVNSVGVSLLPKLLGNPNLKQQNALRATISLLQNARHFLSFSSVNNEPLLSCVERSVHMLRQYCIESKTQEEYDMVVAECTKALRSTQEIILTSQTFLNVPLIAFAVFTSFMMTLLSFFVVLHKQHPRISASQSTLRSEDNHRGNITAILRELFKENLVNTSLSLLFLLQMAMFFASSLIEEEHDVQYFFFTSALFAMVAREVYDLLCLRRSCVFKRSYLGLADEKEPSAFSNWKWQDSRMRLIMLIVLLIVHRFCRTLTEGMRRRWLFEKQNTEVAAMEQRYDLAWIIYTHITSIGSVFAADISQILKDSILLCFFANSFASIALALFFGILMRNGFSKRSVIPRRSLSTGLLLLAFVLIALNNAGDTRLCGHYMCYGIYGLCVIQLVICRSFGMAVLQWMALIIRPCLFPLIPFEMAIGFLLRLLDIHPLVVWFGVTSAFFYAGNSNSLSTVDISVGYVCVQSYQPVIIALQLLLNTYAGPFTLLIAWKSAALLCKSNMVSKHFEIDEKVGICVYSNFKRAAFGYCEGTRNLSDDVKESFKNEPLDVKKHGEGCACKKCGCASASEADGIEIALITHFVLVIFSRMSSCLLSLLIQRHHLFVWSVFAPKFLYECVHLIMVSLYVIYRFMSVVFLEFSAGRE